MTELAPTDRTRLRRHADRGSFELAQIHAILDEGLVCHAAAHVEGTTWVTPTAYGREGDRLYLHGAAANHLLKAASQGIPITVEVTLNDGLVLARSTFNHSFNYRSVIVFGVASEVTDPEEKAHCLNVIVDHLLPGRSGEARQPSDIELKKTRVIRLSLEESSAKVRTGGVIDEPEDVSLPVWAGLLPLKTVAGEPIPDPDNQPGVSPAEGLVQPGRF